MAGNERGAYLGSIRSIADVRLRCVISEDTGCWHLRTAYGKPQRKGKAHRIWVHGKGSISAPRAVWELDRRRAMYRGRRAVRTCESYDCANPEHIKAMTHAEAQRHIIGGVDEMTHGRRLQLLSIQRARRRFSDEQLYEIRNSHESATSLARRFGCSTTSVTSVRNGTSYRGWPNHKVSPAGPSSPALPGPRKGLGYLHDEAVAA